MFLLKSSVPTYTPCVTQKPPSICSSLILRALSTSRSARSFASFLASRSCFVSRRCSSASPVELVPIPRNENSGLLPRPFRDEYTGTTRRSPEWSIGGLAGPECESPRRWRRCRCSWPPSKCGERCSFVELLPILPVCYVVAVEPVYPVDPHWLSKMWKLLEAASLNGEMVVNRPLDPVVELSLLRGWRVRVNASARAWQR
jgi:hypothetical protein